MAQDNIKDHQETYGLVMGLLKWGTVVAAVTGLVVVLLIAS